MNQEHLELNEDRNESTDSFKDQATIGPSIKIKGDISGEEDLVIHGSIEGTINLKNNNLMVGEKGHIKANVTARSICVGGEVKGELMGSEQITIKPSGRVAGNIRAPRVVLDDGCQFKGSIDMDDKMNGSNQSAEYSKIMSSTKPSKGRLRNGFSTK